MSAASAPGLGNRFNPIPPQRGSFPLDHDGECKKFADDYLNCLKLVSGNNAPNCRELAKRYLKCRMDHDLMEQLKMSELGFQDEDNNSVQSKPTN